MSEGTEPVAAKPAIRASRTRNIGSGTIPTLASTIFYQPFGQNGAGARRFGSALEIVLVLGIQSSRAHDSADVLFSFATNPVGVQ